jgi:hypothetical protein
MERREGIAERSDELQETVSKTPVNCGRLVMRVAVQLKNRFARETLVCIQRKRLL